MKPVAPIGPSSIEQLKGKHGGGPEQEKARLRKATQEFEAFFRYQMLKAMRKTVPQDPLAGDNPFSSSEGKDTFLDMMDMELSKSGTGGRGSIADILYRSTEKLIDAKYGKVPDKPATQLHIPTVHRPAIKLSTPAISLQVHKSVVPLPAHKQPIPMELPKKAVTSPHEHIMKKFGPHIEAAADETKLDSALIASVIKAESGGNPTATSRAGAKGLMQLADSTAQDYGVTDAFDPEQNIMAGSRFLKSLIDRFKDVKLALAAYNAGPANVAKYGGLPPFKETREYVNKVMAFVDEVAGQ